MILLLLACAGESPEAVLPVADPEPVGQESSTDVELRLPSREVKTPFPTPMSPDLQKTLDVLGAITDDSQVGGDICLVQCSDEGDGTVNALFFDEAANE